MVTHNHNNLQLTKEKILSLLEEVCDPEIPVLTITDMGIVREVKVEGDSVEVIITPTYSGCPAMDAISFDIRFKLLEHGCKNIKVTSVLSPAWTTDWMSETGKIKLKAYGIAPPQLKSGNANSARIEKMLFEEEAGIECPHCHSYDTKLLSQFGSTACKALYQCNDCREPFDYFKCH
jgi:ring-1,2-phenylacetyl-CoA epoxidase subunit PaaD